MANYIYPSTGSYPQYHPPSPTIECDTKLLTMEAVLGENRIVPPYSLVLGMCADQLPLVLDLSEPSSGAILIAGDSGFANTTLLHSMITSAFLLNTENEVNVHLISPQADSLKHFHRQPTFQISYQPERPECEIVLEEMVTLVQTRERTGRRRPYHTLFIDSLDLLWESLSSQGKLLINWLVTYGPMNGLWIIASLESDYLNPQLFHTVNCFPSRILGNIQFSDNANFLSGLHQQNLTALTPELEFMAYIGGQGIKLWLLPAEHDC